MPGLRFPEFRNAGEWEEKELADILDYQQPTPYLVASAKYNDSYRTPVLTAGKTFLLGYTNEETGIFDKNLPTIIFDDFTTAFKYVDFPFKAKSSAMKMLIPKNNDINLQFVHAAMNLIRFPLGEHKRYWISEYQWEKIGYPTFPEQQKIADCLSSLDDLITAQTQKLAHLKTHKKGLMQQLFPAEGETQPKLRFPEFQDAGDWEEKRLNEIAQKTASSVTFQRLEETPGEYPVFGASGIVGYVDFYNSADIHISIVKDGAGVGRVFLCPPKSSVLGTLDSVIAIDENQTPFVFYWLSQISFEPYKIGSTIPHIYFRDYGKKKDWFPTPPEQQKIAACLTSLDYLTTAQGQKLAALKTHKKGLMQQLFPLSEP